MAPNKSKLYFNVNLEINSSIKDEFNLNDEDYDYVNDDIYEIKNGYCLIINMFNFDNNEYMRRNGSERNVMLIKEAFEFNGFDVATHTDLTDIQLIKLIEEQVNKEECKTYDAFVLYINSHGLGDTILCKNLNRIHFHHIIELFQDESSKNLINKPKILFFDCVRTGNYVKISI